MVSANSIDLDAVLTALGHDKADVRKTATTALTNVLLEDQGAYLEKVYELDKGDPLLKADTKASDTMRKAVQAKVKRVEIFLQQNRDDPELKERLETILGKVIPSKAYDLDYRIRKQFVRPSVMAPQWLTMLNDLNGGGDKIIPANVYSVRPLKLKCLNIEIADLRIVILGIDDYAFEFGMAGLSINLEDIWVCGYGKLYRCETRDGFMDSTIDIPGKRLTSEAGVIHIDDKKIKLNIPARFYDTEGKITAAELKKLATDEKRRFMFRVPVKTVLILNTKGKILAHFQPPKVKVSRKPLKPKEYSNKALMGVFE